MQAEVDEPPAGSQGPGDLAQNPGKVVHVGMDEGCRHRSEAGVGQGKRAPVRPGDRRTTLSSESELIGGQVDPRYLPGRAAGPPRSASRCRSRRQAVSAFTRPQPFGQNAGRPALGGVGAEDVVVPVGDAVVTREGTHGAQSWPPPQASLTSPAEPIADHRALEPRHWDVNSHARSHTSRCDHRQAVVGAACRRRPTHEGTAGAQAGLEPAHPAPEAGALSAELLGLSPFTVSCRHDRVVAASRGRDATRRPARTAPSPGQRRGRRLGPTLSVGGVNVLSPR